MSTTNHHAVIATTWSVSHYDEIMKWIAELQECGVTGPSVKGMFNTTASIVNKYHTVVMGPDGSGEGWADSDIGDSLRERFIARLKNDAYPDGSNPWRWVEVKYGEIGHELVSHG